MKKDKFFVVIGSSRGIPCNVTICKDKETKDGICQEWEEMNFDVKVFFNQIIWDRELLKK